jgi:hypothetical protein
MKLTNYLNAINYSKEPLLDTDDEFVEKKYVPFVVNRCLSYFPDTILHANIVNYFPNMDKKMQFDFLRTAIRKKKRFSKWLKNQNPENLELVKEYFGYSNRKALEALALLTDEDILKMKDLMTRGG